MDIKKTWNEAPQFFKAAIYAAGLFVGYKTWQSAEKIKRNLRVKKELRARGKDIIKFDLPIPIYQNGKWTTVNKKTEVNLADVADGIYDAFYNADWFGFTEDEETAIKELKKVPKAFIKQLAEVYRELHNKNLYNDFRRFLDADTYNKEVSQLLS